MEVGWRLRLSLEDALTFIVREKLAPNVEDAVFIAGDWMLAWEPGPGAELMTARITRKTPRR